MATHLSFEERCIINARRDAGKSYRAIAKELSRSESTIWDEVNRNKTTGYRYCPVIAQQKADKRSRKPRVKRKMQTAFLRAFVMEHLQLKWSPEQISGRLRVLYPHDRKCWISAETIYKWGWRRKKKQQGDWHKHFRTGLKKRKRGRGRKKDRRRIVKGRIGIENRPESVEQRLHIGDWEGDSVVGRYGQSRIATWVERKSRYTCLALLGDASSKALNEAICARFALSPELPIRTITLDNGQEFSRPIELSAALNCAIYFARPHHPWERATNENTNGLIRQFYPKKTDFCNVTPEKLAEVERLLNTRPRKCLQYRTPEEAMLEVISRTCSD